MKEMLKIRLIGSKKEIADAVCDFKSIFMVHTVSDPYPCRGSTDTFRVYVDADIPTDMQVLSKLADVLSFIK